jgi:transaldolase
MSMSPHGLRFGGMERQAREIARWGPSVYVRIPVTDTEGRSSAELVRCLSQSGVRVNLTAVLTVEQVREAARALGGSEPSFVSIFAGRIADTGCDPAPIVAEAVRPLAQAAPQAEVV